MNQNQSALLNVMTAAAIKAGKGLMRDFGEVDQLQISRKGTANFVTKSDVRTEKLLHRELSAARPDFGFLLEEGGEIPGKDETHRFIIDPLDGTSNFIHAIPYFCISIGVEKRTPQGSEIIAGVIYDPIHNDLFTAEQGKGAMLNNRRLSVSGRASLEDAMLVSGKPDMGASLFLKASKAGSTLRYFGATALDLANLAAGRIDACWYHTVKPWDIAAGILLVQEAGGLVSDLSGGKANAHSPNLLATSSQLALPVQKLLTQAA